jgi:plastocyanin
MCLRGLGLLWSNAVFSIMPVALLASAVVEGRVELPKSHTAPVQAKRYEIVTKGGVLSTQPPLAVVYLDGAFPQLASLPTKQVAQKDLTFVPALLPVRVGTKVEFPSFDDTYHNIFSYSPAKRFDLGRYRPDERPIPVQVFDKPGLVTLRCDIHEHMRGLILVLDTPYFTITDRDGHYSLTNVPAGHFTLKAWVDSRTTWERPVELKEGAVRQVDLP